MMETHNLLTITKGCFTHTCPVNLITVPYDSHLKTILELISFLFSSSPLQDYGLVYNSPVYIFIQQPTLCPPPTLHHALH